MRAVHHVLPTAEWKRIELSLFTYRLCAFHFAFVGLILLGKGHPLLAPLRNRVLGYLGRICYGLYLYHPFAFTIVMLLQQRLGIPSSYATTACMVALAVAMASLSWHLIEHPILSWREIALVSGLFSFI